MKRCLGERFPVLGVYGIFILSFSYYSVRSFIVLGGKGANLYKSSQGQKGATQLKSLE